MFLADVEEVMQDFAAIDAEVSLPVDTRVVLIERLQAGLNLPIPDDIDRLWREEVERRVAQVERGEVELIPGEEVFAKIRERYKR
ncbi:MAG: addiction module protein [Patescibacteria group bacterium]